MKSVNNSLKNFLIFLFVIGLAASLYLIYALPEMMEKSSALVSPAVVEALGTTLTIFNVVIVATLAIAVIVVIVSGKAKKEIIEKIVYADQSAKEEKKTEDQKDQIEVDKVVKEIADKIKSKRTLQTKGSELIRELCDRIEASQGILYQTEHVKDKRFLKMFASYAFSLPESAELKYEFGEGLAGQAAKEAKAMKVDDIPEGYITVISGLGSASPNHLIIKPVIINDEVVALIELASFSAFSSSDEAIIEKSVALLENDFSKKEEEKEGKKKDEKSSSSEKGK